MKKVIFAIALFVGVSATANAQTSSKKEKSKNPKMEMKNHVCSNACMAGTHVYAHGEKGHQCTKECANLQKEKASKKMVNHVCTDACKHGGDSNKAK